MTENISLVIAVQQQQQQQQQQQAQQQGTNPQQKPRPLGRVRVQGQKTGPSGQRKSEDFSVQGEAFTAVEKQGSISSSSSSLPPIVQQGMQQLQQRQPSIQSTGSPPGDTSRLLRLQQREQELLKKLQDASLREKQLKDQLERLESMLAGAQQLLNEERQSRRGAEAELSEASDSGDKYRRLYEEECRAHELTGQTVEQLREQVRIESARLLAQMDELKAQLDLKEARHAAQLQQVQGEHQAAIADRDKRIDNLKRQVAGALGTNSHERQSQIDQLNKELQKMVEEVENLRKRPQVTAVPCQQCPKKDAVLRDQSDQVRQLRAVCQRFRGQLNEQEQALVALLDKNLGGPGNNSKPKR